MAWVSRVTAWRSDVARIFADSAVNFGQAELFVVNACPKTRK